MNSDELIIINYMFMPCSFLTIYLHTCEYSYVLVFIILNSKPLKQQSLKAPCLQIICLDEDLK